MARKSTKNLPTWAQKKARIAAVKQTLVEVSAALTQARNALGQANRALTALAKEPPGGPPKNNTRYS